MSASFEDISDFKLPVAFCSPIMFVFKVPVAVFKDVMSESLEVINPLTVIIFESRFPVDVFSKPVTV